MNDDLRNHAPFHFAEAPVGRPVGFDRVCHRAGVRRFVTTKSPPQIRLHTGPRDLLVPLPGRNVYCLSRPLLPRDPQEAAFAAIEKLAYGVRDWAAMETLRAHRRRLRAEAIARDEGEDERRRVARQTLPLRRLLRTRPDASDQELAAALGTSPSEVSRLRASA